MQSVRTTSTRRILLQTIHFKEGNVARHVQANAAINLNNRRGYQQNSNTNNERKASSLLFGGAAAAGILSAFVFSQNRTPLKAKVASPKLDTRPTAGERQAGLNEYSMQEVNTHDDEKKRIWVTYKNGVYDITDFIPKHPGAKNVLMAAGGSVEPFWELYAVHKGNPQVFAMLEEYRIGNLLEADVEKAKKATEEQIKGNNPFGNEPKRSDKFRIQNERPFNAETPLELLPNSLYTPNELFFVRSHLPTPDIKPEEYELEVTGLGVKGEDLILNLEDIKKLPKYTITAAIQCGGNRRSEMNAVKKLKGLNWKGGAIGNATWSGARLYDVLKAAGVTEDDLKGAKHIQFEGYDVGADGSPFGASIPIEKGFNPYGDVLLAYEMNGEPIPRDHGYPIRAVVPGVVGARNVKWLNRITVADAEIESHWQKSDYKGFSPSVNWDNVDWDKSPAIQSMPVTSSICQPAAETNARPGEKVRVRGYAWSGGGNRIIRVDITADGGKSWSVATLKQDEKAVEPRHYGWTLWEAEVEAPKEKGAKFEIWSKAVDSNYNVQPESFENIWNLRGVLSNAYCKVKMNVS